MDLRTGQRKSEDLMVESAVEGRTERARGSAMCRCAEATSQLLLCALRAGSGRRDPLRCVRTPARVVKKRGWEAQACDAMRRMQNTEVESEGVGGGGIFSMGLLKRKARRLLRRKSGGRDREGIARQSEEDATAPEESRVGRIDVLTVET